MGKAGRLGPEVRIFPLNFPMIRSGQLRTAKTYNQFQVWCELSCMSSTSQNGGSPGGSPWLEYVISWGLQTYILLFGGRSFQSHPGFEPPVQRIFEMWRSPMQRTRAAGWVWGYASKASKLNTQSAGGTAELGNLFVFTIPVLGDQWGA